MKEFALYLKNGKLLEGLREGRFRFAFSSDAWGCCIENGLEWAKMEATRPVQKLLLATGSAAMAVETEEKYNDLGGNF